MIKGKPFVKWAGGKRNINSNGSKRGKVEELIITNFINKEGF